MNKFIDEFVRRIPIKALKGALFVSKTIRKKLLLLRIFEVIFMDLVGKVYYILLYSKTRKSSDNPVIGLILQVKSAMIYLQAYLMLDQMGSNIDPDLKIPTEEVNFINRNEF